MGVLAVHNGGGLLQLLEHQRARLLQPTGDLLLGLSLLLELPAQLAEVVLDLALVLVAHDLGVGLARGRERVLLEQAHLLLEVDLVLAHALHMRQTLVHVAARAGAAHALQPDAVMGHF